jgi:peptidoglycan/xylan/chitin deacetylase (PgdA/CDA1 family)
MEEQVDNVLRILCYHRVDRLDAHHTELDPTLLSATPEMFAQQMEYVAHHYCVISVEQLLEALDGGEHLPPKAVMITFDDGYRDFIMHAWPVLRRLRLPSVLFVPTDVLDGRQHTMWWDRLFHTVTCTDREQLDLSPLGSWHFDDPPARFVAFQSIKQVLLHMEHHRAMKVLDQICGQLDATQPEYGGMLSWDEVRQLTGVEICAHTCSHPVLSRVTQAEAWHEIAGSQAALRHNLGEAQPLFAYPCGRPEDVSPLLVPLLQAAGFRAAVTTCAGHNHLPHSNRWRLRRAGLAPHISLNEFRLVLTGGYSLYGLIAQLLRARQQR